MSRGGLIRAVVLLISLLVSGALLELGAWALVEMGAIKAPAPTHGGAGFWDSDHEVFGVWHRPRVSFRHVGPCFDATYETNSVGARDVERRAWSAGRRVIVLGDSVVEGWGLPAAKRLTNLLEAKTGVEHLNLGMSHFGPWQEYLAYREIGKGFSHTAVLVLILPANDFFDLDPELAAQAPWYQYRHRPYLVGTYPDYRSRYFKESLPARTLRRYSYAYNAIGRAWAGNGDHLWERLALADPVLIHSFFYDFTEGQFDRLRYALQKIVAEAEGRRVAVGLVPTYRDLVRYLESGESPLSRRLADLAEKSSFLSVDLLALMHDARPDWERYYFECDQHWNALGNEVAARYLREALSSYFYDRGAPPETGTR